MGPDKSSQFLCSRAKDLFHGSIKGGLKRAIGLRRDQVGVGAKDAVEVADVKLFAKYVDRVGAVQTE